jgi:general secretion pathway protein E
MNYQHTVNYSFAKHRGVMDVADLGDAIEVWMRDGAESVGLAELRRTLRRPLRVEIVSAQSFEAKLGNLFARADSESATVAEDLAQDLDLARIAQALPTVEDLLETEDDAPIIRLINALLTEAMKAGASDIHIEPFETRSVVRFRIDGALKDVIEPKRNLHSAVVSRVKVMANLDISEKRLPQDGRITVRVGGRPVDVRVSTLPTGHGERAVLRLLDKSAGRLDLAKLGLDRQALAGMHQLIKQPHGIVLVTGPTGSGKTTTLYAALSAMDALSTNIMTVEDPIEYDLDGVGQTQVNPRIDMSFARALRAILRQDPDVIMIGEIRDLETAQIAVQASLTGHLVLATLHTNDAPSAVTRLVDMGIEPFLLASSLIGVLAQRLYRQLCPQCRVSHALSHDERDQLGPDDKLSIFHAGGCVQCHQTGYKGRSGVHELLLVDEEIRRLIHDSASEATIRDYANQQGMRSLRTNGLALVRQGHTTLDEILRVTRES